MRGTLVLSLKGLIRLPVWNWAATSSPLEVVGRLGKIDILCAIEYSSHIVLAHHLLPLNTGSSGAGNVL
jgi:hypothetical protein